ncbi:MAG: hypothetical protein V8S89_02240 [Oscillospiraceae bacterium]
MELHCIAARSGKLSSFLQRELRCSSSFIHKTKWLQCFYVNGVPQRQNYIVSPGDEIRVPIVRAHAGLSGGGRAAGYPL